MPDLTGRTASRSTSEEQTVDEYRFDCQSCGQNVASSDWHTWEDCAAYVRRDECPACGGSSSSTDGPWCGSVCRDLAGRSRSPVPVDTSGMTDDERAAAYSYAEMIGATVEDKATGRVATPTDHSAVSGWRQSICACCGWPTPTGACGRCWNGDCVGGEREDEHVADAARRRPLYSLGWPTEHALQRPDPGPGWRQ